ncbi:MAG: carboxylate-amine ligase, partial [Myxococcota bacterium]|nr:carboxylate-amine ligase [Myxococcota bacterium]
MKVATELASRGVMGRFATDFVSVPTENGFEHYAIEVNLRKGGTTHPFLTLRFLTDGKYNQETGEFYAQDDQPKCYFASDTLQSENYKGLLPEDLFDISVYHDLYFHANSERGTVYHLLGALSEFGKLGMVCIGDNIQQSVFLYNKAKGVLDQETQKRRRS